MRINIITTGGTIEKVYSERSGKVENITAKIDRYLSLLRLPDSDVHVLPLMNKDSLEMTNNDRLLIFATVRALTEENAPIIITHGTDTMVQTGLYLHAQLPNVAVPVILTGAMVPLGFDGSDGLQNLTESLFAVRVLFPGIYVVMNGQAFPIYSVRKDHELGRFVWTGENVM
jgi:L-asparaginase